MPNTDARDSAEELTVNDLELKALKNSIEVATQYPLLLASGKPRELLMLMQKCFMEGYVEGMNHMHGVDMKVIHDTLHR